MALIKGLDLKKVGAKKDAPTVATAVDADPMAYIFIGRDSYRTDERSAQDWRRLFLSLAALAKEANPEISQNVFGLDIVFNALGEYEAAFKKALGDKFASHMDRVWGEIQKREADKKIRKANAEAANEAAAKKAGQTAAK
jgi:hypothetical protein